MDEPIKRVHYFDHQFLREDDFTVEQDYHLKRRWLHNRLLHTQGIAGEGLRLSVTNGASRVTIGEGVAIDGQGREIVLTENTPTQDLSGLAGKTVFVTIAYGEKKTDPSADTGVTGDTRCTEEPDIKVEEQPPADPSKELILGRVTVGADGRVSRTDDGEESNRRRSAGVVGGDLEVRRLVLTNPSPSVERISWPALSCSAASQLDLSGSLHINGVLQVNGDLQVNRIMSPMWNKNPTRVQKKLKDTPSSETFVTEGGT